MKHFSSHFSILVPPCEVEVRRYMPPCSSVVHSPQQPLGREGSREGGSERGGKERGSEGVREGAAGREGGSGGVRE